MRYLLILAAVFISVSTLQAQYYFNDIVATQTAQQQYLALKHNHITSVTASSYESDNQPAENFELEQQVAKDASSIIIHSSFPSAGTTITTNYYSNNRLVSTADSTSKLVTITTYQYDASGRPAVITTETNDAFMNSHSIELHQWFYNPNGQPSYMLRIKDGKDTTKITFTYDEKGNAGQETWQKQGRTTQTYFYYYNEHNQLTDIVRYNARAKKLLPDFLYEYDAAGRVTQMTQVPSGSSDYMIWKYQYNTNGLKQQELLYTKQNQLVGRVEYRYQ